jgi:hypothetical protein
MLRIITILTAFALFFTVHADAKPLYLCDEGQSVLLTDDASRGCPAYEPQAELITVPDGATWADVEWAVALKLAARPSPAMQRAEKVRTDPCALWLDLNLDTDGGLDMKTSENTRKWLALSRIVTATNLCEEYIARGIYPKF